MINDSMTLNEKVILFLEGNGEDHAGRTIDFVLDQNDEWILWRLLLLGLEDTIVDMGNVA
jgi:hypothetical protein